MDSKPRVAVLIAVFNGEKFLKQQLDSVLAQTYKNFKIYISDDNSSDSTPKILSTYKKEYPDVIFSTKNPVCLGFVKHFEHMLKNSCEEYIFFCDQDDIWQKNKIAISMDAMMKLESLHRGKPCLVHSDLCMIDGNESVLYYSYFRYRKYRLKERKDLGHILGPCGIMGNTMLINGKLKEIVLPFPDKLDSHDYWIGVNNELFGVRKTLQQPLVQYRIHDTNTSNSRMSLLPKKFKWNRDIRLPNMETNRKYYLKELYEKVDLPKDRRILRAYLAYLEFAKNRIAISVDLLRYSLLKRDLSFRIKFFFKLLLTNRYR
ncbi:glycosyltransferase family 2 protein [Sulfurovum sp. NBC37-1]|uniref:glycosyltransferase family 2 protein n=1 Tax=Sulfurovum sp. (strain NBC37-1) TaxID=387093 RepID=UPI0001587955|nr:glycosyltransferase family 2 protein [Sulfurovum sp. NBC37-1]BAF72663.1 glycosyl transferase [Sulfurovum sp. NBC37-1]